MWTMEETSLCKVHETKSTVTLIQEFFFMKFIVIQYIILNSCPSACLNYTHSDISFAFQTVLFYPLQINFYVTIASKRIQSNTGNKPCNLLYNENNHLANLSNINCVGTLL